MLIKIGQAEQVMIERHGQVGDRIKHREGPERDDYIAPLFVPHWKTPGGLVEVDAVNRVYKRVGNVRVCSATGAVMIIDNSADFCYDKGAL
jgi:hypothetical protein